jgi:predicted RNA-binding protein with TRAM domain
MYGEGSYGGGRGGRRFSGGSGGIAPVKVGEELDVRIEAVGEKGDGIARKRGFVLFVPNTQEGDEVRIRVTKVLRKVGFADAIGQAQSVPTEEPRPKSQETKTREESQPRPEPQKPAEDSEDFGETFGDESTDESEDSEEDDFENRN